ncbi:MAG TPA: NAD-dependent epimerase/dehydratase family protein [Thermoleophilaceae bacterium]|nr:NAD-dependent epimerase/dehydratase family protein [Thermoleophilaceae bacterium]
MRALVTGAAGFIGAHVAAALAASGAAVRAFDREEPPGAGIEDWARGDLLDPDALSRAMDGCDAVFHLAAIYSYSRGDAARMLEVNVEGTRNVLALAGERRVVHTSSAATCGPVPGRPATEQDEPPAWELKVAYKRSKIQSERLALRAGAVVVNPTTPVGRGDHRPTPTGQMIDHVIGGRARGYVRTTALNVVSVEDVARGHLLAHEHGRAGERYILGGDDLPLREVFAIVARAAGREPPSIAIPYRPLLALAWTADRLLAAAGREPKLLVLDEVRLARVPALFTSEKAVSELGYSWLPAGDALREAVADRLNGPDRPDRIERPMRVSE